MAKFHSPLLGYNNNVRHRGRLFHIQTEDSGINHPHVITHLFMDGGRILKSVKKSYAEHVASETLRETVKLLMKEQHKAMFIALRDGQFDELVEGPKKDSDPNAKAAEAKAAEPPPPPTTPELPPSPPSSPEELAPNTIDESRRPVAEPFAIEASPNTIPEPPPEPRRPSASELTLDFDALERDSNPGIMFQSNDLPPPPKNLFSKERGTGAYSTVEVEPHHDDTRKPAPASVARASVPPPRHLSKPPPRPTESGRYAATRPASIFGSTLKPAPTPSVLNDELVSDKSLDEVILSYLAEDLEPRK